MSRTELLSGIVRDVVESGEGVVATERGLVFVRGVLPGEQVRVRLAPKKGRMQRGQLVNVEVASPQRLEPPCKHVTRCGGCPLMHASLPLQRGLKLKFLRQALERAGVASDFPIETSQAEQTLGYRRRARLSFHAHGPRADIGFKREHTGHVADIDVCMVLMPALASALYEVRMALADKLSGEGELSLAIGKEGKPVCVIHTKAPQLPTLYAACDALVTGGAMAGIALYAAGVSAPATFGDATEWAQGSDGIALRGTLGGFSQAHATMNDVLVRSVAAIAETKQARVLELYAGHGNLTCSLAIDALAYTAIEQDAAALEAARANLIARALKVKLVCADALTASIKGPLDVIVLDPPRVGAPGLLSKLVAARPKRIVYVSCDPATLGRDLGEAIARGYRVDRVACVEMFPHTADLESVVRLVPG